jgi:SAM-dependent methyltransferase
VKRLIKALLEPFAKVFRVFFDPRFEQLASRLETRIQYLETSNAQSQAESRAMYEAVKELLVYMSGRFRATSESLTVIHSKLDQLGASDLHLRGEVGDLIRHVTAVPQSLEELGSRDATLLNRGESYEPFAAERGLWFNPPITLRYSAGDVEVRAINERIVEVPFVAAIMSRLPVGARILDVGCAESPVSFSLACLGYEVTGIDLHPYPLAHPRLTTVAGALEDWDAPDEQFDGVVCLSSLEHFGLGAYGELESEGLDSIAMQRITRLAKPGATLALTVPFGKYRVTPLQRIYDMPAIKNLLNGWEIRDLRTALRGAAGQWQVVEGEADIDDPGEGEHRAVLLLAAEKPGA